MHAFYTQDSFTSSLNSRENLSSLLLSGMATSLNNDADMLSNDYLQNQLFNSLYILNQSYMVAAVNLAFAFWCKILKNQV